MAIEIVSILSPTPCMNHPKRFQTIGSDTRRDEKKTSSGWRPRAKNGSAQTVQTGSISTPTAEGDNQPNVWQQRTTMNIRVPNK